ncbi:MAG: hypothetical protein HKN16_04460 [Saprospiraceae bacterium]|nr:hypothetical protein [Saprospiraceae bacterium]
MRFLVCSILLLVSLHSTAQVPALYSMHTNWDDRFTQWTILTMDEEQEGSLTMLWEALNRIDEWEFSFDGVYGKIKLKTLGNKDQWELRIGNEVVTIRQLWPGDLSEWRITDNSKTIEFEAPVPSDPFTWELRQSSKYGDFVMYSENAGDPRDWVIVDKLSEDFPFALKMAMVFVPLIPLLPR